VGKMVRILGGGGVKDLAQRISARLPLLGALVLLFLNHWPFLSLTAYSSTLKIEAVCSSETFVTYQLPLCVKTGMNNPIKEQ
jgi:hypothetical protein